MNSETDDPAFPPLFRGMRIDGAIDPFAKARALAELGCDAGLITHNIGTDRMAAALVLAPEVTLEDAMAMLPVCEIGFQNALGSLAPPELAIHLGWSGSIFVNGARCGKFRVAASPRDPESVPNWMVVGFVLPLIPQNPDSPGTAPGETSLHEEGCVEVSPINLLESWSRHTLMWINRWGNNGAAAIHNEWRGLAKDIGQDVEIEWNGELLRGKFLGVDERFGMLLRDGNETRLLPLSGLLAFDDEQR